MTIPHHFVFNPAVAASIESAVDRLLNTAPPLMSEQLARWVTGLAGSNQPTDYFKHPLAYPIFLLPWWAENTIHLEQDLHFQADLAYSSVSIYYFIRLIDNVMDKRDEAAIALLPALGFLHTQWQSIYQRYFADDHPFWEYFHQVWYEAGEITIKDTLLTDINLEQFMTISGRKVGASKIPIAAVCHYHDRLPLLDLWTPFCERLERWHQFYNDLFGWVGDYKNQTVTYFLSEAHRRAQTGETIPGWVAREGFDWGVALLRDWFAELRVSSIPLQSEELNAYLVFREALLLQQSSDVHSHLASLAKLLDALDAKGELEDE